MDSLANYFDSLKAAILPMKVDSVKIKSSTEAEKIKFHKVFSMYMNADCNGNPEMQFLAAKGNVITLYHFPLCEGFQVHVCNEFLRSLKTDAEVTFITYRQYADLINSIFEHVKG